MPSLRRRSTTPQTSPTASTPWQPLPPFDPPVETASEPPPPAWHPTLDEYDIYYLQQTACDAQTLVPAQRLSALPSYTSSTADVSNPATNSPLSILPSYTIKSNPSAGFMNRKPDVLMFRSSTTSTSEDAALGALAAEVRFNRTSSRTLIYYPSSDRYQEMDVESSLTQRHRVSIDSSICIWGPGDGESKRCLELRSQEEGLIACFTYANEPNRFGYAQEDSGGSVGILQVKERLEGGEETLEQVLCSAVVLVERTKRRAQNLGMAGGRKGSWAGAGGSGADTIFVGVAG